MEIEVREEKINLWDGRESLSLIHISDIHLWFSVKILNKLENLLFVYKPDLVVLTGDYYDLPKGAYHFKIFLQKISENYTTVFILGNHDKIYGRRITDLFLNIPNCFCVENSIYKYKSNKGFNYNLTSWKNKHNLSVAKDEKNFVLIHNPQKIKAKEISSMQLILAGHLHGGQFILFKTKNNYNFPGCILYKYCIDRKQILNTTLIVSKGLGDTFPFRLNCKKEIVRVLIE